MSSESSPASPMDPPWGYHALTGWQKIWLRLTHSCPPWGVLRKPLLWWRKPLKATLRHPVDAEIWGLRLRVQPTGNLSEQRLLLSPQFLDPTERAYMKNRLRPGSVFLDVGANIGVYTFWAATLDDVRIESFEPDPELCQRLRANLAENNLTQVHLNPFALGRKRDQASLVRGQHNRGENQITSETATDAITIDVQPLWNVVNERSIPHIDVLKIDVEGHELEVIEPYLSSAPTQQWPQAIICELDRRLADIRQCPIVALLLDRGYRLKQRTRMNGIFEYPSER